MWAANSTARRNMAARLAAVTDCRGGCGTVFSITTSGTEKLLHSFGNFHDGQYPEAALVNVGGTLYGTTSAGGASGDGTVFSITTDGVEKVLHSFGAQPDGSDPAGPLIEVEGKLYGTTWSGGAFGTSNSSSRVCPQYSAPAGCGTVFSITTSGNEKVLHSFGNGDDGQHPAAGLVNIGGTLYGTTIYGGTVRHPLGHGRSGGTVFSITTSGVEKVVHSLGRGHGGIWPVAPLLPVNGALYGTTTQGGAFDSGTVFVVTTTGKATILHSFNNLYRYDGDDPRAGLVDLKGRLYGTTYSGGGCAVGTVFSLTTTGAETILHSFCAGSIDGADPLAGLIHLNGLLYGTTEYGGGFPKRCPNGRSLIKGCGTVFSVTTAGQVKLLHRFH